MIRALTPVALALALSPHLACDSDPRAPGPLPPATCAPGDRVCYHEPIQDRLLALRCNAGEVDGAIWLIDAVCPLELGCSDGTCRPEDSP